MQFKPSDDVGKPVYEFSFATDERGKYRSTSTIDPSIRETIINEIREFCDQGYIAYFIFSSIDNNAAARERLFGIWNRKFGDNRYLWQNFRIEYIDTLTQAPDCITMVGRKEFVNSQDFLAQIDDVISEIERDNDKIVRNITEQ